MARCVALYAATAVADAKAVAGTAVTADNTVVNVALTGTGNTLANNFAPTNTGTLALGQAAGSGAPASIVDLVLPKSGT